VTAHVPASCTGPARHRRVAGDAGVRLAVVELGPSDAPAWLVAHGAGSSARFITAAFAGPVVAAGARLVTYDLRGHGMSEAVADPAGHHLDRQVADLVAVARAVSGTLEVIGGVSLGGHAVVRALARHRRQLPDVEVALACLPAWTGPAPAGTGPHAGNAAEVRRIGIGAVIDRLRIAEGMPAWLRETLLADYPRHDAASLTATLEALDGGEAPDEVELRALPVPLGVVGWPGDPGHPLAVAERWAALASPRPVGFLHLSDLDGDLEALGRCAVDVVEAVRACGPRSGH
jgi:pimeloyl-ACP methyl ester carboxylesterase